MMAAAPDQSITWSDDFLIGIEELDYEHRCLIEDINKLCLTSAPAVGK